MAKKGESTRQVFLGLLAEEPDTASGVQGKIKDQFPASRFSPTLAHTAAKRLQEEGLVQVVEGDEQRSVERLCLTAAGLATFVGWLHAPSSEVPPFRDATRMRLRLCRELEDLRVRSNELTKEIKACQEAQQDAEERLERAAKRVRLRAIDRSWRAERDCLLLADEVAAWAKREQELYKLQRNLQGLLDQFHEETPSE